MKILNLIYKTLQVGTYRLKNSLSTHLFRFLMKCNNIHYGRNVKSLNGIASLHINTSAKECTIGDNVTFNNFNDAGWYSKCSLWVQQGASLKIGSNTGFNGVLIHCKSSITIGNHVNIGGGTRIFDSDFHPLDYMHRRDTIKGTVTKPIVIEDDVFIGTNCIIGKGVSIGARSIIAAGSVAVKSIPADEVWGGNPAKFIRIINEKINNCRSKKQ